MLAGRRGGSRDLTSRDLVLTSRGRAGRIALFLVGTVLLTGAVVVGVRYLDRHLAADARMERLEVENEQLAATVKNLNDSLENAMLELQIGAVTQQELERQIGVLNEQLKQTKEELEFIKSAGVDS